MVQIGAGVTLDCKERFHQRVILFAESFGYTEHVNMHFDIDEA